jgi:hypothetical protein
MGEGSHGKSGVGKTESEFETVACPSPISTRQDLLAQAHGRAGENHPAEIRRQTAEAKARRVLGEELDKLGWTEAELARQAKGDVRKVHIARRLRSETAVTLKWIAQNLHMGVWTYVSNQLQNWNLARTTPKELRLCQ